MYKYKKSKGRVKSFFIILMIMFLTAILSIVLYKMYEEININTYDEGAASSATPTATRTAQYVENVKNDSKQVADVIEKVNSSIVGISKIKDAGTTIFLKDSTENLGLRNRCNCYRKWLYFIKWTCKW